MTTIAYGATKDAKDKDGWTPLHWAAAAGNSSAAKALVHARADKEATNEDGKTPLH